MTDDDRRTAYWTRPPVTQQQSEPCWASGCTNDAAEQPSPRFKGRYCHEHEALLVRMTETM